ncbi:hypothetical protein Micbo1qcDRAFT_166021 [Microdochium bolleyi]|uniref:Uncharacterized protein n=1 Tax=Microdochium bolleyi TaxID=196109 RepID=A0A136IWE2_9PEZI|nr:hypothetical protein Micbo1qcDRAFT_166021 [Microdochium bolleyi]
MPPRARASGVPPSVYSLMGDLQDHDYSLCTVEIEIDDGGENATRTAPRSTSAWPVPTTTSHKHIPHTHKLCAGESPSRSGMILPGRASSRTALHSSGMNRSGSADQPRLRSAPQTPSFW